MAAPPSYFGTPVRPSTRVVRRLGWLVEAWQEAMWPLLLVLGVAGLLALAALASARSGPAPIDVDVNAVAGGEGAAEAPEPSPPVTTAPPPAPAPPTTVAPPPSTAAGAPRPPCRAGDPLWGAPDPDRYQVVQPCLTVRGTVTSVRIGEGGSYFVRLVPETDSSAGGLFLRILPTLCPQGIDPKARPCGALGAGVPVLNAPTRGARIEARGPLVHDKDDDSNGIYPLEDWHEVLSG